MTELEGVCKTATLPGTDEVVSSNIIMTVHHTTSLETELATLIVQALKLKIDPAQIQPEQALFGDGLGLDSIDALELALAISQTYGYQLRSSDPEIKTVFASLRALSKAIEKNRTK